MIIVSPTLGSRHWPTLQKSKLYDAGFGHRFRRGNATPASRAEDNAYGYPAHPDTATPGQASEDFTTKSSTLRQGVEPGTEDQA